MSLKSWGVGKTKDTHDDDIMSRGVISRDVGSNGLFSVLRKQSTGNAFFVQGHHSLTSCISYSFVYIRSDISSLINNNIAWKIHSHIGHILPIHLYT